MNLTTTIEKELISSQNALKHHPLFNLIKDRESVEIFLRYRYLHYWEFNFLYNQYRVGIGKEGSLSSLGHNDLNHLKIEEELRNIFPMYIANVAIQNKLNSYLKKEGITPFPFEKLSKKAESNESIEEILRELSFAPCLTELLEFNYHLAQTGNFHQVISVLSIACQDYIPEKLKAIIIKHTPKEFNYEIDELIYNKDMTKNMSEINLLFNTSELLNVVCGYDDSKLEDCLEVIKFSFLLKRRYLDGVTEAIACRKQQAILN